MTAIGWRAAAAGLTSSPVRGAGTSTGLGLGDGLGTLIGGLADGAVEALLGDGVSIKPAAAEVTGEGVVGEQPTSKTAQAIASPTRPPWLPRPITPRRIADAAKWGASSAGESARIRDVLPAAALGSCRATHAPGQVSIGRSQRSLDGLRNRPFDVLTAHMCQAGKVPSLVSSPDQRNQPPSTGRAFGQLASSSWIGSSEARSGLASAPGGMPELSATV